MTDHRFVVGFIQAEGVGNSIEKSEQRRDVNGLRDLQVVPAVMTQQTHVGIADGRRPLGEDRDKVEQYTFVGR